jgi:hypothetical protein
MTADELRQASGEMRRLAEAATPGPWRHTERGIEAGDYDDVIVGGPVSCMSYCYGGSSTLDGDRIDLDGDHIRSWHPAVALAVADWLDRFADLYSSGGTLQDERDLADAVARAFLGTTP